MSVATVQRCRTCPRVLRQHEKASGQCLDCEAVAASMRGFGKLREYPLIAVQDLPPNQLCALCQQRNGPERAEAMYHHNDGPVGTHWYAHASCEAQREYDKYEHWRDSGHDERPD